MRFARASFSYLRLLVCRARRSMTRTNWSSVSPSSSASNSSRMVMSSLAGSRIIVFVATAWLMVTGARPEGCLRRAGRRPHLELALGWGSNRFF